VDPQRRLEPEFDPEGEADDDSCEDKNDQDGRAVARVVLAQIEAAHGAVLTHREQAGE
jgi:hypothetical protein